MLIGLLSLPTSVAGSALGEKGVTTKDLTGKNGYMVFNVVSPEVPYAGPSVPLAGETEDTVRGALELADEMGHRLVGTEHILVAVLEGPTDEARELRARGMSAEGVRLAFFGA